MQEVLIGIYKVALVASWPLAIGAILAMAAAYVVSRQLNQNREELRTLRMSLERTPSPAQIGEGMRMWPDVAQFPENLRITEMIKLAAKEEGRRAERVEVVMGYFRLIGFFAFIGVALVVAGMAWRPG